MIFQPSSIIDPRLQTQADDIESDEIGLRVISATVFRMPVFQLTAQILVQESRDLEILEQFILRASVELAPEPTEDELASLLGLDKLFIAHTCENLRFVGAMDEDPAGHLIITESGREQYERGTILRPPTSETLTLVYQPITDVLSIHKTFAQIGNQDDESAILPGGLDSPDISRLAAISTAGELQRIREAVTEAGLSLHKPTEGRLITSVTDVRILQMDHSLAGVLVIQDTAERDTADNVTIRAFDLLSSRQDFRLRQVIEDWLSQERIRLQDLIPPDVTLPSIDQAPASETQPIIPEHAQAVVETYQEQTRAARDAVSQASDTTPSSPYQIEYVRDGKIRPRFLGSLAEAKHSILIVSPWITDEVIDRDFVGRLERLVDRQVLILIGWGIARYPEWEDRRPSEALLMKLARIKTKDGTPAVLVWWLGNQHSKDLLVDMRIQMNGSHNFLSYRGDRVPRGESIMYSTFPEPIDDALGYYEPLFAAKADEAWQEAAKSPLDSKADLQKCCATWVTVRQPEQAITRILELGKKYPQAVSLCVDLTRLVFVALKRLPIDQLRTIGALDLLGISLPDMIDLTDSDATPDNRVNLVGDAREFLASYAKSGRGEVRSFLEDQLETWQKIGLIEGNHLASEEIDTWLGKRTASQKNRKKGR